MTHRPRRLVAAVACVLLAACSQGTPDAEPTTPSAPATAPLPTEGTPTGPATTDTPSPSEAPSTTEPSAAPPSPTPAGPTEVRAVWIHLFDDTLKTRASIDTMIDRAAAANVNTLFVEVVRRQDAYFDSSVLPRTTDPALEPGLDVLGRVLSRAHQHGMIVHAWYPILQTYHHAYDDLPAPPGWVWSDHGPQAPVEQRWVTRTIDGTWASYLDPALPQVRDYVARALADLAARYPVDGIHLDYARYDGVEYGFHPAALDRYRAETGDPTPTDPEHAGFSQWRRDQVTGMVEHIRAALDRVDPDLPLSAAVIAQRDGPTANRPFSQTRPYAEYFQDWASWVETGLLDVAVPMIYFDEASYAEWFDQWATFAGTLATQHDALVVGGQGSWLNTAAASFAQLAELRAAGLDGASLYSYQQTQADGDPQGLFGRLARDFWQEPATVPDRLRGHAD